MGFEGYYILVVVGLARVAWEYMRSGGVDWVAAVLLAVGWVVGYLLIQLEGQLARGWLGKYLKAVVADPDRSPVQNVLTGVVVAVVAVWVVGSSGSWLGAGVVTGAAVRLYVDMLNDKNPKRWLWIFAREFSKQDLKTIRIGWGVLVGLAMVELL